MGNSKVKEAGNGGARRGNARLDHDNVRPVDVLVDVVLGGVWFVFVDFVGHGAEEVLDLWCVGLPLVALIHGA